MPVFEIVSLGIYHGLGHGSFTPSPAPVSAYGHGGFRTHRYCPLRGTDSLSQAASFLPSCLMKVGESVIPWRTNSFSKRVHSVSFSLAGGFVEV